MTEELKQLVVSVNALAELVKASHDISRTGHAHIEETVKEALTKQLPFDHLVQHDKLREFLTHSPEPKDHGDHHDFTEGVRSSLRTVVSGVLKGVGGIILIALVLGSWVWMQGVADSYGVRPLGTKAVKEDAK